MLNKILNIIIIYSLFSIIGCGTGNESFIGESSFGLTVPAGFENRSGECQERWYQLEQEEQNAEDNYNKKLDKAAEKKRIKDKEVTVALSAAEKRHKELMNKNILTAEEYEEMDRLEDKMRRLREKYKDNDAEYEDACNQAKDEFENEIDRIKKEAHELELECGEIDSNFAEHAIDIKNEQDPNSGNPKDTPPPTLYGEELDLNIKSGYEVFLNIGGVADYDKEPEIVTSIIQGYHHLGFHVNLIIGTRSWDPAKDKIKEIADNYKKNDIELKYVVFHHTGHAWNELITYEFKVSSSRPNKYEREYVWHSTVFNTIGATFPASVKQFPQTVFGLIFDGCGQGSAVDRFIPGRSGFVATSSEANNYIGSYIYSNHFGTILKSVGSIDDPQVKTTVLKYTHNNANLRSGQADPQMGKGLYDTF